MWLAAGDEVTGEGGRMGQVTQQAMMAEKQEVEVSPNFKGSCSAFEMSKIKG
jgi:preprotein translocase subunit YajC